MHLKSTLQAHTLSTCALTVYCMNPRCVSAFRCEQLLHTRGARCASRANSAGVECTAGALSAPSVQCCSKKWARCTAVLKKLHFTNFPHIHALLSQNIASVEYCCAEKNADRSIFLEQKCAIGRIETVSRTDGR